MTSLIPEKMKKCFLIVGNLPGPKALPYISPAFNFKKSQTVLGQNVQFLRKWYKNIVREGITEKYKCTKICITRWDQLYELCSNSKLVRRRSCPLGRMKFSKKKRNIVLESSTYQHAYMGKSYIRFLYSECPIEHKLSETFVWSIWEAHILVSVNKILPQCLFHKQKIKTTHMLAHMYAFMPVNWSQK